MPIFGQVWLWSSLAFLLGALLCWALVALPARRRVGELESELASRVRHPQQGEYPRRRQASDGDHERRPSLPTSRNPEASADPARSYAFAGTREDSPPLPTRTPAESGFVARADTDTELADGPGSVATQYLDVASTSLGAATPGTRPSGRGWFDDDPKTRAPGEAAARLSTPAMGELDQRLIDDEPEAAPAEGGTVFTQRTQPVPGELIREIDEAGQSAGDVAAPADEPADALVDDLADTDLGADTGARLGGLTEQTVLSEPVATPGESEYGNRHGAEVTSQPQPEAEPLGAAPAHGAQGQTEVMPAHTTESPTEVVPASGRRSAADESVREADEPKIMPGVTVRPEPASSPLPKRVPGKPRGHTPFGVETSPTPEPASVDAEPTRALFEPIVPAEDSQVVPPPHRVRGDANGRGPFGPGSAMPLPGGASPSPEFTIKASVSALRYCTPESPQFGRTVAEVWFKTPADAERVGFRPVG